MKFDKWVPDRYDGNDKGGKLSKPVIYLAGPMTGIKHFNFEVFDGIGNDIEQYLNWEVLNPALNDVDNGFEPWQWNGTEDRDATGFDLEAAMEWDLAAVRRADFVVVLPFPSSEWVSEGFNAEKAEAERCGKPLVYLTDSDIYEAESQYFLSTEGYRKLVNAGKAKVAATYSLGGYVQPTWNPQPYQPWIQPGTTWPYIAPNTIPDPKPLFTKDTNELTLKKEPEKSRWTGDEIRTTSSTGGQKGVKGARFDLIPVGPLTELAEHYGKGAEKYDDNQWRKGYEWSKSFAALMRHANQFWGGEDFDEETGSNHMAAVAWHALAILEFFKSHPEFDDRFKS